MRAGSSGTVPLPGGASAVYYGSGFSYFRHKDWLGSSRLATTWDHLVYSKTAYAPFGEQYNESGNRDRSFTGQDQDASTQNYDFQYRQLDSTAGRWMSPDPAGWSVVDLTNPQSFNRYAYVMNSPLDSVDPLGLDDYCVNAGSNPGSTYSAACQYVPNDAYSQALANYYAAYAAAYSTKNSFSWTTVVLNWEGHYQVFVCTTEFSVIGLGIQSLPGLFNNAQLANGPTPGAFIGAPSSAPSSDPCYNAQLVSAGVGPAQLRKRITSANKASLFFGLLGYASLVRTGGPQDDKNLPQNHSVFGPLSYAIAAGNISFGATCPFGAAFCQFEAGAAQTLAGHPDPNGTLATGFDTPSDNAQIRQGQAMRAAGCHS